MATKTHLLIRDDGSTETLCVPDADIVEFIGNTVVGGQCMIYEIPPTNPDSRKRLVVKVMLNNERVVSEVYSECVRVIASEWEASASSARSPFHAGAILLESDSCAMLAFPGIILSGKDMARAEQNLIERLHGLACIGPDTRVECPGTSGAWPMYGTPLGAVMAETPLQAQRGLVPEKCEPWDWAYLQTQTGGIIRSSNVGCSDVLEMGRHSLTPGSSVLASPKIRTNEDFLFWMIVSCSATAPRESSRMEQKNDVSVVGGDINTATTTPAVDQTMAEYSIEPKIEDVESFILGSRTRTDVCGDMVASIDAEDLSDATRVSAAKGLIVMCGGDVAVARDLAAQRAPGVFKPSDFSRKGSRYDRATFVDLCSAESRMTWLSDYCVRILDNATSLTHDDMVSYIGEIYNGLVVLSNNCTKGIVWYVYHKGHWVADSGGSMLDKYVKERAKGHVYKERHLSTALSSGCMKLKALVDSIPQGSLNMRDTLGEFCGRHRDSVGIAEQAFYGTEEVLRALCRHLNEPIMRKHLTGSDRADAAKISSLCETISQKHEERIVALNKLLTKIKTQRWWSNVKKSMESYFLDIDFRTRLDSNPRLLGVKGGVLDLGDMKVRKSAPMDFVSKRIDMEYREFEEDDPLIVETTNIIAQIFPNQAVRKYFWETASMYLEGKNNTKTVYVWTGEGDNAKTFLMNFIKAVLGPYFETLPTTVISGRKPAAGKATPEMAKMGGGVRAVFMNEPNDDEVLNTATLKNMSGNDPMYVRPLYDNGYMMIPMYKLVLVCNDLPRVSSHDKAFWGRIRVIPFQSRFTHTAPKDISKQWEEKHFARDDAIEQRFPSLAPAVFYLLVKTYQRVKDKDGNVIIFEPREVLAATNRYKHSSNDYNMFLQEVFDTAEGYLDHPSAKVRTLAELHAIFKGWYRDSFPNNKVHSLPVFSRSLLGVAKGINEIPTLLKIDRKHLVPSDKVFGKSYGAAAASLELERQLEDEVEMNRREPGPPEEW